MAWEHQLSEVVQFLMELEVGRLGRWESAAVAVPEVEAAACSRAAAAVVASSPPGLRMRFQSGQSVLQLLHS